MSILDRVTKAVSDTVDRGKKEVDQFVRIQKIKGEIGESERKIDAFKNQVQQTKVQIGEKAIEMLRAGTLASPELQPLMEQIAGFEQQVAAQEAVIAEKKADIEKIKAEDEAQKAAAASAPPAPAPPEATPARCCSQCGTQVGATAAFCGQCGAKLA